MIELGGTSKFITCKVNSHNCCDTLIKLLIFFYSKDAPIIIDSNAKGPLHVFTVPILWLHKLATIVGSRIGIVIQNTMSSCFTHGLPSMIPFLPNTVTKALPCPWE